MDEVKKNKVVIGAVAAAVVAGLATFIYLYGRNQNDDEEDHVQRTLALIKPDAFKHSTEIKKRIAENGFLINKSTRMTLTKEQAALFYSEHRDKPFFKELTDHMTSGPVWALMLERKNAVRMWRDLMGSTNPSDAKRNSPKCIRALYGTDITKNAVHGSDSLRSAKDELEFFFDDD